MPPAVTNQTPSERPLPPATTLIVSNRPSVPESLSPYDIRNFIDGETQLDLTTLWQMLQIRVDPADSYFESCYDCQAEIFEYELDGQPGNEILLEISDDIKRSSRYLIFGYTRRLGEWKLLGRIDSFINKYRMSQHKIFISGGRSWLVVNSQGASGSGVASYYDRVFLVNRSGVHEVLSYASEGHESGWPSKEGRDFFGQLVSCELNGDLVTAAIGTTVQYFGEDYLDGGDGILLWEKEQKAFFTRRLGQSEQVFNARRSTLSERELDEVYNIDSLTEEGYFEYNSKELAGIATGTDPKKREWLRRFLAEGEETNEIRRLRRLLASS